MTIKARDLAIEENERKRSHARFKKIGKVLSRIL